MLESVMTRTRAKLLIFIGWLYCILLAVALILSPLGDDPLIMRCQRHAIPQTVLGVSGVSLIISLLIIQVKTLLVLKERTRSAGAQPGHRSITTGRLRLYKRAMGTTVTIALVYTIAWLPVLTLYTLNALSIGNKEIIQELLARCSFVAFVIQSFANAFIFRLKNLNKSCFTWCKKQNRVSAIAVLPRARAVQSPQVEESPRTAQLFSTEDPPTTLVQRHSNIFRVQLKEVTSQNPDVHGHEMSVVKERGSGDSMLAGMIELGEISSPMLSTQGQVPTIVTTC